MAHPVLPPKYYQTHFFEMLDFVENYYVTLLDPVEASFISTLKSLKISLISMIFPALPLATNNLVCVNFIIVSPKFFFEF